MSQLATTFVQYFIKIGLDVTTPLPPNTRDRYSSSTQIVRRIETAPLSPEALVGTSDSLKEQEMDLLVRRAMSHNQAYSNMCLGCRQTGHTLTDCNRFVDYIVVESLAQQHPQLTLFCSCLNIRNADGRPPTGARTVRSILSRPLSDSVGGMDHLSRAADASHAVDDEEDASPDGYQLNALRGSISGSTETSSSVSRMPTFILVSFPSRRFHSSNQFVVKLSPSVVPRTSQALTPRVFRFCQLSETYDDPTSRSVFAHADNGSMACTTSDASLLVLYRTLNGSSTKVRLFDAGSHSHHPNGVGFLCLPAYLAPSLSALLPPAPVSTPTPCCVFVRTYHTASIPGVIISHCAIAKQLSYDR